MFDLSRFLDAQEQYFEQALKELTIGFKTSHWMWFILPQLRGLGSSDKSHYYGITSKEEACAYVAHHILFKRYLLTVTVLLRLAPSQCKICLGELDFLKLHSSLTLFYLNSGNETLKLAIDKYFNGILDSATVRLLEI